MGRELIAARRAHGRRMPETQMQLIARFETATPAETMGVGAAVASHCAVGDIIALIGELGAGKTQFTRGFAEGLGYEPAQITSPTFVIAHEHADPVGRLPVLVHVDAYRLRSIESLESIGWDVSADRFGGEMRDDAIVLVEWADRLAGMLGDDALEVRIEHIDAARRRVTISAASSSTWVRRLAGLSGNGLAAAGGEGDPVEGDRGVPQFVAANPASPATDEPDTSANTPCPICGRSVAEGASVYPFCSARCRTIDLGKWLGGDYVISRPIEHRDLEEGVD